MILLLFLFPKEHHSSSLSSFLSTVLSRFIQFVIFSKKHDSQYATELPAFQPATLVFKYGRPPTEVVYALQASIIFVLLRHEEHKSSRYSCPFAPKDQNKLFAHDKNRKRVELWVRTNLYNVFVMYALDSAHVKVRRIFCRCIRQARPNRTAGRPEYKSAEPN